MKAAYTLNMNKLSQSQTDLPWWCVTISDLKYEYWVTRESGRKIKHTVIIQAHVPVGLRELRENTQENK